MKKGYLIFHHNLMFSSIPSIHYKFLIENIYSEILNICEEGVPIAVEFNGYTLKLINSIAPNYINRLKNLLKSGKCLLIGSSYTQAAFPLIPAEVNRKNIKLGFEIYNEILGEVPDTCLLNEQIYSESTVDLMRKAGYKNFIFDYPNAFKDRPFLKDYDKWTPLKNRSLNVIWGDCIATQQFQKVVWGDIDFSDYISFVDCKCNSKVFPVYCGDAEVFEYIPGSLNFSKEGLDFANIRKVIKELKSKKIEFVLPTAVIEKDKEIQEIEISSPSYPIKTKKHTKYNITRWAVTGRDAMKMNGQCYELYKKIRKNNESDLWERLCYLWGSDFRTNTTDEKYLEFRNAMGKALSDAGQLEQLRAKSLADTHYKTTENGRYFSLETETIKLTLLKNKGLAIHSLHFKKKHVAPCIGIIPQGYFNDIAYSADFFSMHSIAVSKEGRQITDLSAKVEQIKVFTDKRGVVITTEKPIDLQKFSIVKEYILTDSLQVNIKFYFYDFYPLSIRTGIVTFLPKFLNNSSFQYATHNGGSMPETFKVENELINHSSSVNQLVSAETCLGDTEEMITVGCNINTVSLRTDKSKCYTVPLMFHKKINNKHFCRIYNSMCEQDDVSHQFFKGYKEFTIKISGD